MEFLNSQPYYASKKIVIQSSDFPVRRTGSYRHKKALGTTDKLDKDISCSIVSEFDYLAAFSNAGDSKLSDVENDAKFPTF